ncbi:MAG TPA: DivIVA domain-containing protein [Candidatus Scatovivens faecipullorum]|jgi:divIVA family protein|nr:DivIVA domain-containing protein [Candidatus Scatovivens faecipullorum]
MLTPLDIENKRFSKTLKGYNVDEVDDFLDQLTIDYERLYKENSELKEKVEESKKDLEHYKSVEQTLQNTLIMAQTTAEDIKTNAQSRAEQIIRDAQSEARRATEEITKEEFEIRKRTEELKRQLGVYKAKMEALLISQLELLQDNKDEEE